MKPLTHLRSILILSCVALPAAAAAGDPDAGSTPAAKIPAVPDMPAEALHVWKDPEFQRRFAESYVAVTEVEPSVTTLDRDVLIEFQAFMEEEDVAGALELLTKNKKSRVGTSSGALYDFFIGNHYFVKEEWEEAEKFYLQALDKFPKYRRAHNNLGLVYVQSGNHEKAVGSLSRVIELGGHSSLSYGLLGFAHLNVGNYLAAESALRMAILLDPKSEDWTMQLAQALYKQQRFPETVALFGSLIEKEPERAELWMHQASAYVGMGNTKAAAENYELAHELGGSTPESLDLLGRIYINEQLYDLAADAFLRKLALPERAEASSTITAARILAQRGAMEETQTLVQAIEATYEGELDDGARKDLLKLRSRIAVSMGAEDAEVEALEAIVQLDPLDGDALILLGKYNERIGETETAVFYFERAANLEKYEADAKLAHAQLLVGAGRYAEALPLLRRAHLLKGGQNLKQYLDQIERLARQTR